jgi:hypothetical protein
MGAWSRLQKQLPGARVIFAVQKLDAVAPACAEETGKVWALLDPGGRSAWRYNARWPSRAFVLDARGVLIYVQPEIASDMQVPLEVGRLWRG